MNVNIAGSSESEHLLRHHTSTRALPRNSEADTIVEIQSSIGIHHNFDEFIPSRGVRFLDVLRALLHGLLFGILSATVVEVEIVLDVLACQ